jgi:hypothetical protein
VITSLLLVWLVVGAAVMFIGYADAKPSAGMPLAYFLQLSLIHTPGAAVYAGVPLWSPAANQTLRGFEETITGFSAFLAGVVIIRLCHVAHGANERALLRDPEQLQILDRLSVIYIVVGMAGFFFFGSMISLPTVGALISQLTSLVVVGACLRLWVLRRENNVARLSYFLVSLPLLPIITLVKGGFLGAGVGWVLTILSFVVGQSRRRVVFFAMAPFFVYFGLSVFVNYMAARNEFRQAVWVQQVGIGDRLQGVADMFSNFQWYDSENPRHRRVIDDRLNQNLLVGAAVERLQLGLKYYAKGQTLVDIAIGLIPRALWPDKPQVGGGGSVVADFAGIKFGEGTSVGAGQVLEFYVNFGTWGVIGGFLLFGFAIGWMDLRIAQSLETGDQKSFVRWFLVCMAFMQPGGNLIEIVVTAVASVITAFGLNYALSQRVSTKWRPS